MMDILTFTNNNHAACNDSVDIELLHACVDEICGHPGPSYHRFVNSMDWSRAEYEGIHKLMSALLRNPASLYMVEEKVGLRMLSMRQQNYYGIRKSYDVDSKSIPCTQVNEEKTLTSFRVFLCKENCFLLSDVRHEFDVQFYINL